MTNTEFDQVATAVCESLEISTDLGKKAVRVTLANLKTLDNKQKDYGRANLEEFGSYGVLIRFNDKISRLKNLYKALLSGDETPNNEPIDDSWLDSQNYSVLGYLMLQEEKSKVNRNPKTTQSND